MPVGITFRVHPYVSPLSADARIHRAFTTCSLRPCEAQEARMVHGAADINGVSAALTSACSLRLGSMDLDDDLATCQQKVREAVAVTLRCNDQVPRVRALKPPEAATAVR